MAAKTTTKKTQTKKEVKNEELTAVSEALILDEAGNEPVLEAVTSPVIITDGKEPESVEAVMNTLTEEVLSEIKTDESMSKIETMFNEKMEVAVNKIAEEVNEKVAKIQEKGTKIMKDIEASPENAEQLLNNELKRVEKEIARVEKEIQETLNNKVFTTNTWNGWGYNG
jgi:hypothetical protein